MIPCPSLRSRDHAPSYLPPSAQHSTPCPWRKPPAHCPSYEGAPPAAVNVPIPSRSPSRT
eukprot:1978272-Prymnesium_polylepis.2